MVLTHWFHWTILELNNNLDYDKKHDGAKSINKWLNPLQTLHGIVYLSTYLYISPVLISAACPGWGQLCSPKGPECFGVNKPLDQSRVRSYMYSLADTLGTRRWKVRARKGNFGILHEMCISISNALDLLFHWPFTTIMRFYTQQSLKYCSLFCLQRDIFSS